MNVLRHTTNRRKELSFIQRAGVATAVIVATILPFAGKARAEDASPPKGTIQANVYDHGKTKSIALGVGKGFSLPAGFSADTSMAISSGGKTVMLEAAELDLNTPATGNISGTFYAYVDNFYYVAEKPGIGGLLNVGNLHVGAEYINEAFGSPSGDVFAKYAFALASGSVRLTPKMVGLFSTQKVESVGAELKADIDIGGATLFAKAVHGRNPQTFQWMNGNMQAGVSFDF